MDGDLRGYEMKISPEDNLVDDERIFVDASCRYSNSQYVLCGGYVVIRCYSREVI